MVSLKHDKQIIQYDLITLITTIILVVFGILFIYSSGYNINGGQGSNEWVRQIIWAVSGLILLIICSLLNYNILKYLSPYLYAFSIGLLVFTLFFGKEVNGATSWLGIGSLGIQPSEFSKLSTILYLGVYLEKRGENISKLNSLIKGMLIIAPVTILTLLQPDLGTALVFLPIIIAMTFVSGASWRHIVFICITMLALVFFIIFPEWLIVSGQLGRNNYLNFFNNDIFIWSSIAGLLAVWSISFFGNIRIEKKYFYVINFLTSAMLCAVPLSLLIRTILKDYQKMRLMIFLDPTLDPRGAGWNVIQSKNAIGSGGLLGKGFLQGAHSQYHFLPQQSTDFIFSILSEEWGYLGSMCVLALFSVIIFRGLKTVATTKDRYASLIGVGILVMIVFHFTINVGMTVGIMPITGIPLIFLSHGGSALWVGMISIGIIISIRQFKAHN